MYADRMPNTRDILLPYRTAKKQVYQTYSSEVVHHVSESTFYGVWTRHFPNLKVKKSNSFSQCTKCAVLQRKFEGSLCPVTRLQLRKERSLHNQRQMLERKCYYSKRQASRQHPDEFLSLIIDGMDQSKTDMPHFVGRQAKSINPAALLKTHITGVISHGHGLFASFLDILQYPHDPNLTINVILRVLQKISLSEGSLPPVLYLQMDNSPRDNKNKYVFGFCEALVRLNVFHEVQISFLYVGHTHEDIDASFSKMSEKLSVTLSCEKVRKLKTSRSKQTLRKTHVTPTASYRSGHSSAARKGKKSQAQVKPTTTKSKRHTNKRGKRTVTLQRWTTVFLTDAKKEKAYMDANIFGYTWIFVFIYNCGLNSA